MSGYLNMSTFCRCWQNTTCISLTKECTQIQNVCDASFCKYESCKNSTTCFDSIDYYQSSFNINLILICMILILFVFKSVILLQVNWIKSANDKEKQIEQKAPSLRDLTLAQFKMLERTKKKNTRR